ncbi:MAG: SDR family NAD(P)-dependent oxidoreductase [Planctomycetes bacterium]|nr:SDR family oxidoreductase [Phycisphaerae bacterium]NBB94500.1 SDR family NAD(P)-dependent oxidoreductase [Planctomycetota bacterium]
MAAEGNGRPVALVTGASAGIGAKFARQLARRGCDLVLVARRRERLEALADELHAAHDVAAGVIDADLTDEADRRRVCDHIHKTPNLQYLVNNAGFGTTSLFYEADADEPLGMVELHVRAPVQLTHAALPAMVERGRGFVVNVSSVAAFLQGASGVMYCATKAFLNSFTLGLAAELRGKGVKVQALCPGFTYSEFHDVAGIDRSIAGKFWWLDADYVVRTSLAALDGRTTVVIPSLRYKFMAGLLKVTPQWLLNHAGQKRHETTGDYPA